MFVKEEINYFDFLLSDMSTKAIILEKKKKEILDKLMFSGRMKWNQSRQQ